MASRTETSSPWRSSRAPRGFSPSRANGSRNLTILVADLLTNAMTTFRHRARMVSSSPSQITSPGWMNYANSVSPSFTVRSNAVTFPIYKSPQIKKTPHNILFFSGFRSNFGIVHKWFFAVTVVVFAIGGQFTNLIEAYYIDCIFFFIITEALISCSTF